MMIQNDIGEGPLVGIPGLAIFSEFLETQNMLWDFSKDIRSEVEAGHVFLPTGTPTLATEQILAEYTWLVLLYGSVAIPSYIYEYLPRYDDEQLDWGTRLINVLKTMESYGLLDLIDVSATIKGDAGKRFFENSTSAVRDLALEHEEEVLPSNGESFGTVRLARFGSLGENVLNERLALSVGRPSIYVPGAKWMLPSRVKQEVELLKGEVCELLVPCFPIFSDRWDIYLPERTNDPPDRRIARIAEVCASSPGVAFRALSSSIFANPHKASEAVQEFTEIFAELAAQRRSIKKVKRLTFLGVTGIGVIGIFNPWVGVASLVASVVAPLLMSQVEKRRRKSAGKAIPAVNYLLTASEDLQMAINAIENP